MRPANEVVAVAPNDSIRQVMDKMLEHRISSVVVMMMSTSKQALGIITKSDLMKAYHDRIDIDSCCSEIMTPADKLEVCSPNDSKDQVATILESTHHHHVLVVEDTSQFVGLVSTWDISSEDAKDSRAWPYLRGDDGTIDVKVACGAKDPPSPPPEAKFDPNQPTTIDNHQHDFKTYMDDLDLMGFQ